MAARYFRHSRSASCFRSCSECSAAWLSLQLLDAAETPEQGQISFAIWGLFVPSALDTPGTSGANAWIEKSEQARAAGFVAGSNVVIYTPVAETARLDGRPMPAPQEFISVRATESFSAALLGFNLLAAAGLVFFLRRRLVRPASGQN